MNSNLTRLREILRQHRRRRLQGVFTGSLLEALCLQLLIIPVLAWISSRQEYEPVWLYAILATYAFYIWPLIRLWRALRGKSFQTAVLSEALDRFNPEAPDIFRTLLSLENHTPETLAAIDHFFSGWENRIRIPEVPLFGRLRLIGIATCAAWAVLVPAFTGEYFGMARRMAIPLSVLRNLPVPRLQPLGLPDRIALGDTLRIPVRVEKLPTSEPVYAHVRFHGKEERYPLERRGDTAWFQKGPVQGDFKVRFAALRVETSEHRIRAVPPPSLRSFSALVQPPPYTRLSPESLQEVPATLTVPMGSQVSWQVRASQPLKSLVAIFQTSGSAVAETLQLGSGSEFNFKGPVRKSNQFRFRLTTADGLSGNAGPFTLEPAADLPPEIALLSPAGDGEMPRSLKVPIMFRAQDDYGISRVTLHYAVLGASKETTTKGSKDVTPWLQGGSGMGGGLWEAEDLPLQPGAVVEAHLEVADNDAVSGRKTARSQRVRLRLPSLEEALAKVEAAESGAITNLRSAAERAAPIQENQGQLGSQSSPDAPPPMGSWEARRILNSAPQDHLLRLERHLEAEAALTTRDSPLGKQLESLRKETKEMQKRLPPPEAWQKPPVEQQRLLDTLNRDQQKLDRRLSELKPLPPPSTPQTPLAQERKALQDELQRNLKDQNELRHWLKDQERDMNAKRQDLKQAAQAQERAREDVKQALSQMQKSMEKGMENGVLSKDLLEKMERIQELLKEALPDSTLDRLRQDAQNQQVGLEDLQRNLKDMMSRRQDMKQGLDRAIRMLEMLRDMRALENLSRDVHALEEEQEQLAGEMENPGNEEPLESQLESKQARLRQRLENTIRELNRLTRDQKALQGLKNQPHAADAKKGMEESEKALGKSSREKGSSDKSQADKKQAKQSAKSAANALKKMAAAMDDLLNRMQGGPDPSEIAAVLDETLEFGRWQDLIRDKNRRLREGWGEEDPALNQRAVQLAHWLRARMERLAARQPFESEVLRREALAMSVQSDLLGSIAAPAAGDSLLIHTRKAARELLKWLKQANDGEDGSSEGEGSGSGSASGGKQKGKGKGKGQGESDGDEEGLDGLAGRMRGVSGKQMAVNQATYQLLRSMLEGRSPGQGAPGQGTPGQGTPGQNNPNGSSPFPGGNQPSGGDEGGNQPGGNQQGGNSPGESPGGAANGQQGIGESLERLGESANDAGGAARKLRQLAEEARELERDLRQGRATPEELRKKQERFQTRLLEAANAMEERGQDRKRQAEAYRGESLKSDVTGTPLRQDVYGELRRRRDGVRQMALPAAQKRRLELYYENLLTR